MKKLSIFTICASAATGALLLGIGCGKKPTTIGAVEARPSAPKPLDFSMGMPNEAGFIPILEYHEITSGSVPSRDYQVPISQFRDDMEKLYSLGYRPIGLHDFLLGKIDVPTGMSPVIITFDDSLRGQVDFDSNGQISPDCAAGVLVQMNKEHNDWPLRGVFFIVPMRGTEEYFYQKRYSAQKLKWLTQQGFEIGNHTLRHLPGMNRWPDSEAEGEIAGGKALIQKYLPNYPIDTLALPFGVYPRNEKVVMAGSGNGVSYRNLCAMKAGAAPTPPPFSLNFRPYRIPRIIPGNGRFEIDWWLDNLEKHKKLKYVSDGDPWTVTVPERFKAKISMNAIKKDGLFFRSYPLEAKAGRKNIAAK
jgi:peptidoglycan/xylan/chitin deacetylase (PgdA/CDA1 family)